MKRTNDIVTSPPSACTRSKKPKLVTPVETSNKARWVSATDIRNYIMKDTLIDWLKLYGKNKPQSNNVTDFLKKAGIQFEKDIVEKIKTNIACISVSDTISDETCTQTIQLMNEGIPVIHSAPFRDTNSNTQGIIDLLVRCDYLKKLVKYVPDIIQMKAPNLQCGLHYVVVDIKFSTLPLRADGVHLLNSGSYPSHKAQVCIYTNAIANIQGYLPRYGYIMGRRWGYSSNGLKMSGIDPFDRLGVIDFHDIDKDIIDRTDNAIEWITDLRKNGKGWTAYPPSRPELYPNMCVDSKEWNAEKAKIAEDMGDITQIWHCGPKNREKALQKGITSWKDPKCTAKILGMGGNVGYVVDRIIEVNRGSVPILPEKIKSALYNWRDEGNEAFVDFETFCDVFSQEKSDQLFMIGIYYKNTYKSFTVKKPTLEEEHRIMQEFVTYIRQIGNPRLWYWSADQVIWGRAESRQLTSSSPEKGQEIVEQWKLDNWCDACQLFISEPIVIKGCYKFGLKNVAEAMKKHGMINCEIDSDCKSGFDAGILARQAYDSEDEEFLNKTIKDIEKYNEFDVKVLSEILEFLRREK